MKKNQLDEIRSAGDNYCNTLRAKMMDGCVYIYIYVKDKIMIGAAVGHDLSKRYNGDEKQSKLIAQYRYSPIHTYTNSLV